MRIEIPGRMPGMNEMIDAAKHGKGKYQPYAEMEELYTTIVAAIARKLPRYSRADITIKWIEPNCKRDPDNIMAGTKFVLDGLVKAGTLPNDTQKHINSIRNDYDVDKDNPRVEVEIEEVITHDGT